MEPETKNQKPKTDLSESLAWLDYCLGESMAAMEAVKRAAAAVPELNREHRYKIYEVAAVIITLRGRCRRWANMDFGYLVPGAGEKPGDGEL